MDFQLDSRLAADSLLVGTFELCQCRLLNDSQYPWFILVPMRANKIEIYQLSHDEQNQLWLESRWLSEAAMKIFKGDKLNIAAIGNVVSQLHLHHVVRFIGDACWPKPIWGQLPLKPYQKQQIDKISHDLTVKLACFGFKAG